MIWNQRRVQSKQPASLGLLLAQPKEPTTTAKIGLQPLGLDSDRDGFLYVPTSYRASHPAPLVLMLHGAGGKAQYGIAPFQPFADAAGLVLLAVDSRLQTWDVIMSRYGSDIQFIDRALAYTFDRCAIDPTRIAIEGFSDGASYALSVGISNGNLFSHIIAFSPGFMAPAAQNGSPNIFISHGKRDNVLLIERCSRKIVPQLQQADYQVLYREFDDGHIIPEPIIREALKWFMKTASF
ncbi:alpha/beta hydrolase [Aerosakkonemataceae cyanobacterium BLCC-F50]|uniref:Alpha/beta hydrolase n=1 Tax=Floridaenema flaviceps BLCC-F50 TaxID=3153642 RepID=A0ABV4Y2Q6_9CYAN